MGLALLKRKAMNRMATGRLEKMLKEVSTGGLYSNPRAENSVTGKGREPVQRRQRRTGSDLWARASAPARKSWRTLAHREMGRCLLCPPPVVPEGSAA